MVACHTTKYSPRWGLNATLERFNASVLLTSVGTLQTGKFDPAREPAFSGPVESESFVLPRRHPLGHLLQPLGHGRRGLDHVLRRADQAPDGKPSARGRERRGLGLVEPDRPRGARVEPRRALAGEPGREPGSATPGDMRLGNGPDRGLRVVEHRGAHPMGFAGE